MEDIIKDIEFEKDFKSIYFDLQFTELEGGSYEVQKICYCEYGYVIMGEKLYGLDYDHAVEEVLNQWGARINLPISLM